MWSDDAVSLERRCSDDIARGDRQRGRVYFHQRRVTLIRLFPKGVQAAVDGAERYLVSVDGDEAEHGSLKVSCSCPRFDDGFTCKHVWATLLAMDAARESWRIPGGNDLRFDTDTLQEYDGDMFPGDAPRIEFSPHPARRISEPSRPGWQNQLRRVGDAVSTLRATHTPRRSGETREILYQLDPNSSLTTGQLVIGFFQRRRTKSGQWSKTRVLSISESDLRAFPAGEDRDLLQFLLSLESGDHWSTYGASSYRQRSAIVPESVFDYFLPRLCATGRFHRVRAPSEPEGSGTLVWDDGPPWTLALQLEWGTSKREMQLIGCLRSGTREVPLAEPLLLLRSGVVVFSDRIARLEAFDHFPWVAMLRREAVTIPAEDQAKLVETMWSFPALPPVALPPGFEFEEARVTPVPGIRFRSMGRSLGAEILFDYDGESIPATDERRGHVKDRTIVVRDRSWETRKLESLRALGLRPVDDALHGVPWQLSPTKLPEVAALLLEDGWTVEAEGVRIRRPGTWSFSVTSGIDWLDLDGGLDFGGELVAIPDVLRAFERGEAYVQLSDGSHGMLPEEWLARSGALADLSPTRNGTSLRFGAAQVLLLDALLEQEKHVRVDRGVEKLRKKLRSFAGIEPALQPRGFRGELRHYQREGLGWLSFLCQFGFGGCLADDMGLGKTIQVLALLQLRRLKRRGARQPSLLVVPRSLVHNWLDEAARFVPNVEMLDYSGARRAELAPELADAEAVITTYGVVRRDLPSLKELDFDFVILDEAQAIKNRGSQIAKCCRLLRANHRLALTGTPIENHLDELLSIFEFLNPGMLGRLGRRGTRANGHSALNEATTLAPALRPFILRRTKGQVLADLPPKSEQTILCVLGPAQRKLYDELRRHYQASLSRQIEKVGLGRSKIKVLEALLRLRQAACHPGLLDPGRGDEKSAKLEMLLERIVEVIEEGHKALVFSQFTKFLAVVRSRLDEKGLAYEYLDGRTRDRKARVERYQNDPDCPLFLVSLKAGGLGLNLTAADYVFLLDPWWNPATESQAIDRAHRIGQTRPVFAYRLIAEDTVEEKILTLQETKRELADAIISENNSLVRNLTASDLELLLG